MIDKRENRILKHSDLLLIKYDHFFSIVSKKFTVYFAKSRLVSIF